MRLHDARGDRVRALHVYHACAATLERELGVQPSAQTRAAYEALLPDRPVPPNEPAGRQIGAPALVGRAAEWARLTDLWRVMERGRAQFALVTGEPGVGKTRLIEDLRAWCVHRGAIAAEAASSPAEGALAYGPVVAWLRAEPFARRRARLDGARLSELARLLPELLTEIPGLAPPEPLPADEQRTRQFDAIVRAILAPNEPVLLVADDLQWYDRETLQFLHYLLRVAPDARLLVAASAREEDLAAQRPLAGLLAGLHALECCSEIPLARLTGAETAELAACMAGRPLDQAEAARLFAESEGLPLFVVEALRAGWQGEPSRPSPKVRAAIAARLAQLSPPARELAGLAATIGRSFSAELLAEAQGTALDTVIGGLDELWRRRIVREQGIDGYEFSHEKLREAAEREASPIKRRRDHLRIAVALERRHASDPDPASGEIARHYEQAGAIEQAIPWLVRAAEWAKSLHANADAAALLEHARDLLLTMPESPARDERELALLTALPGPVAVIDGWASERLADTHRRALDLVQRLAVEPAAPLLSSLAIASLSRRDFTRAAGYGGQLRARGERDGDDTLLVEGAYVLGITAFWQGAFEEARAQFELAVARYRPEHRRDHLLRYGLDPKVVCLSRLGNTYWVLGRIDEAVAARDAALALADETGHPFSRSTVLVFAAMLALELDEIEPMRRFAALLLDDSGGQHGRPAQIAREAIRGYLDVRDGRIDGLARIEQARGELMRGDQAPGMRAQFERLLLAACVFAGDARTGLTITDRALASEDADRLWEAENRRARAEFLAVLGRSADEVEAELDRALTVARRQEAAMLELRVATTLLRTRLERGDPRAEAAREALATLVAALPGARASAEARRARAFLDCG